MSRAAFWGGVALATTSGLGLAPAAEAFTFSSLDHPVICMPNGHCYQAVYIVTTEPQETVTWEDMRDYAATRTHDGMQGFLWTPSCQEIDDLVPVVPGNYSPGGFIGARLVDGVWTWMVGPKAGQSLSADGTLSCGDASVNPWTCVSQSCQETCPGNGDALTLDHISQVSPGGPLSTGFQQGVPYVIFRNGASACMNYWFTVEFRPDWPVPVELSRFSIE